MIAEFQQTDILQKNKQNLKRPMWALKKRLVCVKVAICRLKSNLVTL